MIQRTGIWRGALVVLALASLTGCGKDPPPRPRGLLDAEGRPVEGRQRKVELKTTTDTATSKDDSESASPASLPSPFFQEPEPVVEAPQEEKVRDLGQELSQALGEPASCLDVEKAGGLGGAHVQFTAIVLATGRVSRATVTAQGQPPSALRCLEEQVSSLRLEPPIKDAPVTVRGETTVQVLRIPPKTGTSPAASATAQPAVVATPEANAELAQPERNPEMAGSPDRR